MELLSLASEVIRSVVLPTPLSLAARASFTSQVYRRGPPSPTAPALCRGHASKPLPWFLPGDDRGERGAFLLSAAAPDLGAHRLQKLGRDDEPLHDAALIFLKAGELPRGED